MLYFNFSTELKEILYCFNVICNLPDNIITAMYLFWILNEAILKEKEILNLQKWQFMCEENSSFYE